MLRFAAFCSLILLVAACNRAPEASTATWSQQERLLYFGIPVRVLFSPADAELEKQVWTYLEAVDRHYNDWRDDTEIGRINAAPAGQAIQLSPEFAEVWRRCKEIHDATDGAFDPSVRPLRQLWRQAEKSGEAPTADAIAAVLAHCGIDKFTVDAQGILTKNDADASLDFGGIIKGVAVDRVVADLRAKTAAAALVQVGGETAVWGNSQRGRPHAIAIQHPLDLQNYWTVLEDPGSGFSCATSGNYRNPIRIGDQTYYHVFDPRNGLPVNTDVLSVTILFPQPGKNGLADALSTAGAVLGSEKSLDLAAEFGAEALILLRDGDAVRELASPGFAKFRRP